MARILLGVSGGIAAYKAVEVVRLLTGADHAVRVIQTPTSLSFVGRASFEAVSGAPVLVDEFEPDPAGGAYPGDARPDHAPISHLELVRRCDAYCIAPASANTIAKLALGLADNLLTSAALACRAPLLVAPAMNNHMYEHPATGANLETLRARGATIVPPGSGRLASHGEQGAGRLAEPLEIVAAIKRVLGSAETQSARFDVIFGDERGRYEAPAGPLSGLRVLVTAGGTREPIDAVRYVGNRSSGRMGVALAAAAAKRGAQVVLIRANVTLPRPAGVRAIDVETAAELEAAARAEFPQADVLLMAAAVADFRPAAPEATKIAKAERDGLALELEPTTDVLAALASERRPGQTLIGFAAEHGEGWLERGRAKLERKGLDAVVVNDISRPDIGFDAEHNEVTIITPGGTRRLARASKEEIAGAILDQVGQLRERAGAASTVEGER